MGESQQNHSPTLPPEAGVDGCPGGWIVAIAPGARSPIDWVLASTIQEVANHTAHCRAVAVDIPIGLPDEATPGGRPCDREARALLPPGWKSSVFTPPARGALQATSYPQALEINRASSRHRMGFAIQAWNIVAKIREVDDFLAVAPRENWIETFPELAFMRLNGMIPVSGKKKTLAGQRHRRRLLCGVFGSLRPDPGTLFPRKLVQVDDLMDALACCHVAGDFVQGAAQSIGDPSVRDARGRTMRIRY